MTEMPSECRLVELADGEIGTPDAVGDEYGR